MNTKPINWRPWAMSNSNPSFLSIRQALRQGEQQLAARSDTSRIDSQVLLAHALDKPRSFLLTWPEQQLDTIQTARFKHMVQRRQTGEPIAYITGQREFWSMELEVNQYTLIPRPETEALVELALEKIPVSAKVRIADLGTGSGAIALAIAKERPKCQVVAIDQSANALATAKANATKHSIENVEFRRGSWFEPIKSESFDVILSNPPYVAEMDPHLEQGDLRFEPRSALTAGPEGMDAIRHIVDLSRTVLKNHGWILLEHGYNQGPSVKQLLIQSGFQNITIQSDLGGLARVAIGQFSNSNAS
jgi:release factor glutamine methyltransferase